MHCNFRPACKLSHRSHVVTTEGRIFGLPPHRQISAIPVHLKGIGIERMLNNLVGRPEEQWIINVKRLGRKWEQRKNGEDEKQSVRPGVGPGLRGCGCRSIGGWRGLN